MLNTDCGPPVMLLANNFQNNKKKKNRFNTHLFYFYWRATLETTFITLDYKR